MIQTQDCLTQRSILLSPAPLLGASHLDKCYTMWNVSISLNPPLTHDCSEGTYRERSAERACS